MVFFRFSKIFKHDAIRLFGYSFFIIAIHIFSYNSASYFNLTVGNNSIGLPLSLMAQFSLYFYILLTIAGFNVVLGNNYFKENWLKQLVFVAFVISLVSTFPFASETTVEASMNRYLLRVSFPQVLTGSIFVALYFWLTNYVTTQKSVGQSVVRYALLGFGFLKISIAVVAYYFIDEPLTYNFVQGFDYINLFGVILIGIGLIIWLLENENAKLNQAQSRIDFLSCHDQLTGLANRNNFLTRLEQSIQARRNRQFKTLVVLLGLDNFKKVNESSNLNVGDQILIAVADRLQNFCPTASTIARLGGDVFALMFERLKDQETIDLLVKKVESVFDASFLSEHQSNFEITASIGVALSPEHGVNAEKLVKSAEYALFHSKTNGTGRLTSYQTWMTEGLEKDYQLQAEIKEAFLRDEFVLNFQPLIELSTNRLNGFEVLVRWQHPQEGIIPPSMFLPILDRLSMMSELDELVLRKAAKALAKWRSEFDQSVYLAVNLSPQHFQNEQLPNKIAELLKEFKLKPDLLQLEITENAAMSDIELGINVLRQLKLQQVTVAMDDFGTGYSSMSYLRQLPVDKIKIDRSFILSLEEDPSAASIVKAIASLANGLNKKVVAEGIETSAQRKFVNEIGCYEGQGFGLYRPLDFDQATGLLKSRLQ